MTPADDPRPASAPGRERRAILVINPKSRSGGAAIDPALRRLEEGGVHVSATYDGPADGAADAIRRASGRHDLAIVGGGDGTLNACASALMETGLPLGILPLGTGNDLARTLAIPTALEAAADVIVAGHQMRIDVGEVNGVPFLNVASIGMSVQLAEELTADVKRRFGALGYLVAAMRTLRKARTFRASIASSAGQVHVRTLQIAVGNGRHYGAGMTVAANARIDDQLLDLYSIETSRIWRIALMARALRSGRHIEWPEVRAERAGSFQVDTRHPMPVNVDGELLTSTPARFTIRPLALSVCAPAPSLD